MSNYYDYHDEYQQTSDSRGEYYNDQRTTYSPYDTPEKNFKNKKGGFGKKITKAICLGLVFGLAAGASFIGIHKVVGMVSGDSGSGGLGTTVNIVKTSSQDVELIKGKDVSDIITQCMPSIVAVNTKVVTTSSFFGQTFSQEGSGAGSGFIISEADGILYMLTNYHVIENSSSIQVTFNDGKSYDAQVKGYDENADIAVLTVASEALEKETKEAIAIAVMGDSSEMKAGNGAIAIGNALGYGQSVTTGIISAVDREVQMTDGTVTLIQTDAAINPGNSGGALLNTRGEVIGVNTIKYADTNVEGMGFAIPINSAMETAQGIIDGSIVPKTDSNTAYLGISGGTLDEASAEKYGYPSGVYVSMVSRYSAAERAGLRQGDIITEFNGEKIETMEDLQNMLYECLPGDEAVLTISRQVREGSFESMELKTILGARSDIVE